MPATLGQELRSFWRVERRPATTRARVIAAAVVVGMLAAAALLLRYDPTDLQALPACPTYGSLGVYCPGCGSTRAVHHLLHARIGAAWRHNPALVLVGLPFLVWLCVQLGAVLIGKTHVTLGGSGRLGLALAVALVVYAVARNVPVEMFDALRPPES